MTDGIFHDRLQGHLWYLLLIDMIRYIDGKSDGVIIAEIHKLYIILYILHFLANRHITGCPFHSVSEQFSQRRHRIGNFIFLVDLRHHFDSFQNIVNKMRVDLILKGFDLCVFDQYLSVYIFLHQYLDVVQHLIELGAHLPHFITAGIGYPLVQIPVLNLPDHREHMIKFSQKHFHNTVHNQRQT